MVKWIHEETGTVAEMVDHQVMIAGWVRVEDKKEEKEDLNSKKETEKELPADSTNSFDSYRELVKHADREKKAYLADQAYVFTGKNWKKDE